MISALAAGLLSGCAHAGDPPLASTGCTDSKGLHQAVWGNDGIERRQALSKLGACGPEHWELQPLMAPLPELSYDSASEAWINLFTGLDPQSVEEPERMTDFLLLKASDPDAEVRRLAVYGLGLLLERLFATSSLVRSQPTMVRALNDPNAGVRQAAAEAFAKKPFEFGLRYHNGANTQVSAGLRTVAVALAERSGDLDAGVRASVVSALTHLSRLDTFDGVKQPPLSADELFTVVTRGVQDTSARVRLAALEAAISLRSHEWALAQQALLQGILLRSLSDPDDSVMMAALQGLKEDDLPALASVIGSGMINRDRLPALLSDLASRHYYPISDRDIQSLLFGLRSAPEVSIRINTERLRNKGLYYQTGWSEADLFSLFIINSLSLYAKGLQSEDPNNQIDAIIGISELMRIVQSETGKQLLVELVEPSLSTPWQPVRWAAATLIGGVNPNHLGAITILADVLATTDLDDVRRTAQEILNNSQSTQAASALIETASKDNRDAIYVRSCRGGYVSVPTGQAHVAAEGLARASSRRVMANIFGYIHENDQARAAAVLTRLSRSKDPDVRFNATYAMGTMITGSYDSPTSSELKEQLITELKVTSRNTQEVSEVRRIAATMLQINGQRMPDFLSSIELPMPDKICPNPLSGRTPGFVFDPYEGRCLYDTRTGCGDGLGQIYDALRKLLSQRNDR